MTEELEKKEVATASADSLKALEDRLAAFEKQFQQSQQAKVEAPKIDPYEEKIKELTKRIEALQQKKETTEASAIVDDALQREQEMDSILNKAETRDQRIARIEKLVIEDIERIKLMLAADDYPQYFFSSGRRDDTTEKIRRFSYHANRLGGQKFIEGYKKFVIEEQYNKS